MKAPSFYLFPSSFFISHLDNLCFFMFLLKLYSLLSKSINEESPDYEAIKALRDSVDSLNYKFDDSILPVPNAHQSSGLAGTSAAANAFHANLAEISKEFSAYDSEFSANNWADLQSEEVA
jgi:hypothetical protein